MTGTDREATVRLRLGGRTVAAYQLRPELDPTLAPRPYLHPVYTPNGTVVTDAHPADHRWHLGASLAVPDVSGSNLWGGRSYRRATGYQWRDDHGQIVHEGFDQRGDGQLAQRLRWCDRSGAALLAERRRLRVFRLPEHPAGWVLELAYALTASPDRDVTLGSPATHGRPGGAGYGGFFWRAAPAAAPPQVFTAGATGEAAVNGSTDPWLALASGAPAAYTLLFTGLPDGQHWFVRAAGYPGVCAAFAFAAPRVIRAGTSLTGRHRVLVADGGLAAPEAGWLATVLARRPVPWGYGDRDDEPGYW